MGTQVVEVRDFPGMTLEDALKIAVFRLTKEGNTDVAPLPSQPDHAKSGVWRLAFRVADRSS